PERLLETVHGALGAAIEENLVDRDRPDPDRAGEQAQHDGLHDPMSLQEQGYQRYVGGDQRQGCRSHVGGIHERYPLNASVPIFSGSKWLPVPQPRVGRGDLRQRESRSWCRMGARRKPGLASPANMSKRGLPARHSVPNQTLSLVNFRLPKGNPAAGNPGRPGGYGDRGPGSMRWRWVPGWSAGFETAAQRQSRRMA